jgi:hypothetical protein
MMCKKKKFYEVNQKKKKIKKIKILVLHYSI